MPADSATPQQLMIATGTNPFETAGEWLRGNTHAHTTASDGQLTVPELARWYESHGYDFLCVTDHDVVADLTVPTGTSHIALIPGAEIGVKWEGTFGAEICALGIQSVRRKYVHPQQVIDDVNAQGGVAVLSHPHMSGVHAGQIMQLTGLAGIEIFNAHCFGSGRRGFATTHWDELLTVGQRIWGIASDDRHSGDAGESPASRIDYDKGRAWVMVKSADRSPAAILSAIRNGLFYATNGPQIHDIQLVNGNILVKTSPVRSIRLATVPWCGTCIDAGRDRTMTEAMIDVGAAGTPARVASITRILADKGFFSHSTTLPSYFRIECWDGDVGYAWSNPFFLNHAG